MYQVSCFGCKVKEELKKKIEEEIEFIKETEEKRRKIKNIRERN